MELASVTIEYRLYRIVTVHQTPVKSFMSVSIDNLARIEVLLCVD